MTTVEIILTVLGGLLGIFAFTLLFAWLTYEAVFRIFKIPPNAAKRIATTGAVIIITASLISSSIKCIGEFNDSRRHALLLKAKDGQLGTAKQAESQGLKLLSVEIESNDTLSSVYQGPFASKFTPEQLTSIRANIGKIPRPDWMKIHVKYINLEGTTVGEVCL